MKSSKKIDDTGQPPPGDVLVKRILTDYQVQVKQEDASQSKSLNVSIKRQVFLAFLSLFIVAATAEELIKQQQTTGFNINQSLKKSQIKVNQEFKTLETNTQFFTYLSNFLQLGTVKHKKGPNTMITMPQYQAVILSDLRLTNRRVKLIQATPFSVKWAANTFDGFYDSFDPDVEQNTSFTYSDKIMPYKTQDTFKNLGGFTTVFPVESTAAEQAIFFEDFKKTQDRESASLVVDILLYNTEIEVFYMLILQVKKDATNKKTHRQHLIGPVPRNAYDTNLYGISLTVVQILIFALAVLLFAYELYKIAKYCKKKQAQNTISKEKVDAKTRFKELKEFLFVDLRLANYAVISLQIFKNVTLFLQIRESYKLGLTSLKFDNLIDISSEIGQLIKKGNLNNSILKIYEQNQLISILNCVTIVLLSFQLFYNFEMRPIMVYKQVFSQIFEGFKNFFFTTALLMTGFTLFTYFQFGDRIESFSSFNSSFFSNYLLILGDETLVEKMIVASPSFFIGLYCLLMFIFKLLATFLILSLVVFEYDFQRSANETVQEDDFQTAYQQKHWSNKILESCRKKKTQKAERLEPEKPSQNNKSTPQEVIADQENQRQQSKKDKKEQPHNFLETLQTIEEDDQFDKSQDQKSGAQNESNYGFKPQLILQKISKNEQEHELELQDQKNKKMQLAILQKMDWNKKFSEEAYDSDSQMIQKLSSDKQDEIKKRKKEKRCGIKIWETVVQIFYCSLFIIISNSRLNQKQYELHNKEIQQLIGLDMIGSTEKNKNVTVVPFGNFDQLPEVEKWLTTFPNKFVSQNQTVPFKTLTDMQMPLYYLGNNLNYILMQGFVICFEIYDLQSPIRSGMKTGSKNETTIIGQKSKQKYYFDQNAFDGVGGHCVNVDARRDISNFTLQNLRDDQFYNNTLFLTRQVSMQIVTVEATSQICTYNNIVWAQQKDSLMTVSYQSRSFKSDFYGNRNNYVVKMVLLICFILFFCVKSAWQFRYEFGIMRRYENWKQINIQTLSEIEKNQRAQQKPEIFRSFEVWFRLSTVMFLVHILITVCIEALWLSLTFDMQNVDGNAGDVLPLASVVSNVRGLVTNYQREQVIVLLMKKLSQINKSMIFLEVLITLNVILMIYEVLVNFKHHRHMRMFLYSMQESFLEFLRMLCFLSVFFVSFVLLLITSFGYQIEAFQNLSWAIMTTYVMSIDFNLASYCNQALEVNYTLAYIIWLILIPLFVIFQAILLAIVTDRQKFYMKEDYGETISLWNAITFCRYNFKEEINKMKEEQEQEKRKMDFIGHGIKKKKMQGVSGQSKDFDRLEIQLTSQFDPKKKVIDFAAAWAVEIQKEILDREELRQQLEPKKQDLRKLTNLSDKTDTHGSNQLDLKIRRDHYLLYLQNGTKFFELQRQLIETYIRYLEDEIIKMNLNYKIRNELADKLYIFCLQFEKPLIKKVEEHQQLKVKTIKLRKEQKLLQDFKKHSQPEDILQTDD